jgi:hypothetical protein
VETHHKILEGSSLTEDSFLSRTANLSEKELGSAKKNITSFSGCKKPSTTHKATRSKSKEKENRYEIKHFVRKTINEDREFTVEQPCFNSLNSLRELMLTVDLSLVEKSTSLYALLRIG